MKVTVQIKSALAAHRMWKERLKQAIDGGASAFQPAVVRMDNRCDFGKWLYHQIPPEAQQSTHYQTARQLHARFHLEAARILDMALHGQQPEAQVALGRGSVYDEISAALNSELIAWHLDELKAQAAMDKTPSPDKLKAVLEGRARALAQSTHAPTDDSLSLVVFSVARERYGIATDYVREVQPLRDVTPVPCTPGFVVGVVNIRGSIYSVIDIRSFFGIAEPAITGSASVIRVSTAGLDVGILADEVKGATSVRLADVKPPPAAQTDVKEEYIRGVTRDMLTILNLEALLRDERIIVREEVD